MKQSQSLEQCADCNNNAGSATGTQNQENKPVTYDEGNGVKDKIVMTGPLSEVFTQALNVVFEKKPMELTQQPPEAPVPTENTTAQESYSGDFYLEQMISQIHSTPELAVVLSDFDVKSVKDHIEDVKKDEVPPEAPCLTTVLVTDVNDIVKPEFYEKYLENDFRGILLTVGDMGGIGPVQAPKEEAVLLPEDPNTIREAVERLFESSNVKLCFGMEAFRQELLRRKSLKASQ